MNGILSWWDGVELWLSGLVFVLQTVVVMPVVLALAYGIALLLDGALGNGIRLLRRARHQDEGGTGLGLAIARDIARSHGGDIMLGDSPTGGLRATVRIPV